MWILFLGTNGAVISHVKISASAGGFGSGLDPDDHFGSAIANLGDIDGNGTLELAVGAEGDDDGGDARGAIWILSLNSGGSVVAKTKISSTSGGFGGALNDGDGLGWSLAALGDVNGDGNPDLAAGTPSRDIPANKAGSAWTLFLNPDGSVKATTEIGAAMGGFTGSIEASDLFGASVAGLGDLDGDGTPDLGVGASADDSSGQDHGRVWIAFLEPDGSVREEKPIGEFFGGFSGQIDISDFFGFSLANVGDINGDGVIDLVSGAPFDDDGGTSTGSNYGAAWVLMLDGVPQAAAQVYGCGVNPAGSLSIASGAPAIGSTITFGLDDPAGNFPAGALPFFLLGLFPDANFPCGSTLPGFGLDPGEDAELLISLSPPTPIGPLLTGAPWTGPGTPTSVSLDIPNEPNLIGIRLYGQGVLFDPPSFAIGLTDAVELLLGLQ